LLLFSSACVALMQKFCRSLVAKNADLASNLLAQVKNI